MDQQNVAGESPGSASQLSAIRQRASRGLVVLVIRQILSYGSVFVGNLVLSRWVSPDIYGVFAAALALQMFLTILGDGGLGLALIQRQLNPTQEELASLFTLQFILLSMVAIISWVFADSIASWINLGVDGAFLLRALSAAMIITSFRTIPAMLLERELHFDGVALAEVSSTVVYQIVLLIMVWFGWGVKSIVMALSARFICDLIIIWSQHPWRPQFSLRIRSITPYLLFGLNMQGVRLMSYAKDYFPTLLLTSFLGATSTGYWTWALAYIGIPVYFNRLVDRVMFPAFSRSQQNRESLVGLIAMTLWLGFVIGLPILFILLVFARDLIPLLYGSVWLATLPLLLFLTPNMLGGFVTGSLFPVLYATGQSKLAIRVFLFWISMTLVGVIVSVLLKSLEGMAIAYSFATLIVSGVLILVVPSQSPVKLLKSLGGPFIGLSVAGVGVALCNYVGLPWFVAAIIALVCYSFILIWIDYSRIAAFLRDTFH